MYVALSRVTKMSGLYIIGEFKLQKTSKKENGGIAEMHRLRREREMKLSYDNLCNRKDKIIYQNVGSLNQTFGCIMADEWDSQADILVFSETLTKPDQIIRLHNFKTVYRTDMSKESRGILCLVRNGYSVSEIQQHHFYDNHYKLELLYFKTDTQIIITGYKSPSTPNVVFTNALDKILTSCEIDACIIVIGDFNFDVLKPVNYLSCFMNNHNLYSILPCKTTTNMNTQIDVIFTKSPNVTGGIYETFFFIPQTHYRCKLERKYHNGK